MGFNQTISGQNDGSRLAGSLASIAGSGWTIEQFAGLLYDAPARIKIHLP